MPSPAELPTTGFDQEERDRSGQSARTARNAWFIRPDVAPVMADLRKYGEGARLSSCSALQHLLTCPDAADAFTSGWVGSICALLAREPLGQSAFAFQNSRRISVFQLAAFGSAELAVLAYEPDEGSVNETATAAQFAAIERREICLAGRADIACVTRRADCSSKTISLDRRSVARGDRILLQGAMQAKIFEKVESRLVILRLSRTCEPPSPVQEIRLADGAIVHHSSGDMHASRQEIAMALLARMRRKDAIPALTRLSREGDEHLRWEAMRHCLSLDTGEGFRLLRQMAREESDSLSKAARSLLDQLLHAYPQLREMDADLCPT